MPSYVKLTDYISTDCPSLDATNQVVHPVCALSQILCKIFI